MKNNKPVVCFWDIETSHIVAATFGLYNQDISHENIIQDWFIISGAWKKSTEKGVKAISVNDFKRKSPTDDYGVVKALRDALEDVDILVHHNGDKFDLKKLTARLIYHGLPPLPKIVTIDTLKEVKKIAQFTSNRLDYLGTVLVGKGKEHTSKGLWLAALKGDKHAIEEMVAYNKIDVIRLEQVYYKLKPYIKNPPHMGVLLSKVRGCSCPSCGGENIKKRGVRVMASGIKKQELQCKDCGHYHTVPYSLVITT